MSFFSNVTDAPPIEVLEMKRRHDEDDSPCKINLTVGGYKVSLYIVGTEDVVMLLDVGRTVLEPPMCCPW